MDETIKYIFLHIKDFLVKKFKRNNVVAHNALLLLTNCTKTVQ